jgi:hypothetical protein
MPYLEEISCCCVAIEPPSLGNCIWTKPETSKRLQVTGRKTKWQLNFGEWLEHWPLNAVSAACI